MNKIICLAGLIAIFTGCGEESMTEHNDGNTGVETTGDSVDVAAEDSSETIVTEDQTSETYTWQAFVAEYNEGRTEDHNVDFDGATVILKGIIEDVIEDFEDSDDKKYKVAMFGVEYVTHGDGFQVPQALVNAQFPPDQWDRLKELTEAGDTVVFTGVVPTRVPYAKEFWIKSCEFITE